MPQIVAVSIKGFQSHIDSALHLGPGLNVITGPSDSGKTAVIRAVRWVAFGEPSGEAFVNAKAGEAEVTLTLDNGVEIKKHRKSGKTKYWVTGHAEPFEKAEVPQEVKLALGIDKQTFGDFETALNFAYQLEAPFIISETASAGAKILGKLAGTEVVDLAVKAVGKDTYAARQERQQAEKDIARINGDLVQYDDLDDLKQALDAAEYVVSQIDEAVARKEKLESLHTDYHTAKEILYQAGLQLDRLAVVPEIQQDLEAIEKAQLRYDTLLDLYSQYGRAAATVERLTEELAAYEGVGEAAFILEEADTSSQRLATLINLSTLYTDYTQEKREADKVLSSLEGVDVLARDIQRATDNEQRLAYLRTKQEEYNRARNAQEAAQEALDTLRGLEEAEARINAAAGQYERITTLRSLRTTYRLAKDEVEKTEEQLQQAVANVNDYEEQLRKTWEAAGGICPLCDQVHEATKSH